MNCPTHSSMMFAALARPRHWVHPQEVCQRIGEALRRQAGLQRRGNMGNG